MAFHKMLWVTDKSTFKVKVRAHIRNASVPPFNVNVRASIRNASVPPFNVTVTASIRNGD